KIFRSYIRYFTCYSIRNEYRSISIHLAERNAFMGDKSFKQLGLNDLMVNVTEKLYFKTPTKIQQEAIPSVLHGKSIIGESQTGSGKTHAYLLPLLQQINETLNEVQIVITAPTRELAMQIFEEIKTITKLASKEQTWISRLIVGGMDRERMIKQLERRPHLIV